MRILEQECRFFEHILDTVKPDFFFSKMPAFHHLELFYEMCKNSGVNVQIIDFALLGQSCMITQEHEKLDIVRYIFTLNIFRIEFRILFAKLKIKKDHLL